MTVSLGGIALSDHLRLDGLESRSMVAHSVTHTIGGRAIVQYDSKDMQSGIELALVGENHFTLSQIQAVQALAGQEVTLVHHRGTYQVIILSTPNDSTFGYSDPTGSDWYSGSITMVTV